MGIIRNLVATRVGDDSRWLGLQDGPAPSGLLLLTPSTSSSSPYTPSPVFIHTDTTFILVMWCLLGWHRGRTLGTEGPSMDWAPTMRWASRRVPHTHTFSFNPPRVLKVS